MSYVEEGIEDELSYLEFRQLTQDFKLRIPAEDVAKLDSLPGPSLLACSNRHGLLFFPLSFGFGWAKLSSLADGTNTLDYGKFELDDAVTSALKVGGKDEKWLVAGNGLSLHIFDLDLFAADPVSYEPQKIKTESNVSQVIFGHRVLALAGTKIIEVDCENSHVFDTSLSAKLVSCDEKTGKMMIVTGEDEIVIVGAGLSAEKHFVKPDELESLEIKSFFCINEWDVVVSMEPKDKAKPFLDLYHIDLSSSDPAWSQFFDPTRPRKKAPSTLIMAKLGTWDHNIQELVFIGNAFSADIGTMGRLCVSSPMSTFFLSTEEYLPQLPVSVASSREDQYPIGMALDFTNPELTPSSSEMPPYPASPILWILTNEGFLCPYRVIKNDSRTPYPGMALKSGMEFPNVLKKRPTSSKKSVVGDEGQKESISTPAVEEDEKLDISAIASGFTVADYGKYTNALISQFLAIRDMVQTDIGQIRAALAQSGDLVSGVRKKTTKSIRHLEQDTLKLAQDCDNPAFLGLFRMESDLQRMACDVKSYQTNSASLRTYTSKLAGHAKALQQHRDCLARTVDSLDAKVRVLAAAKCTNPEEQVSVQQLGERADKLKGEVVELEQSLSLLKLSGTRGKTSPPVIAKPTSAQLTKFAAKLTKRDPKQCLSTFNPETKTANPVKKETPHTIVDPPFYSCVFPVYDEDAFLSEPEEPSPQLGLGAPVHDTSRLDEFDYEEPEPVIVEEMGKEIRVEVEAEPVVQAGDKVEVEVIETDVPVVRQEELEVERHNVQENKAESEPGKGADKAESVQDDAAGEPEPKKEATLTRKNSDLQEPTPDSTIVALLQESATVKATKIQEPSTIHVTAVSTVAEAEVEVNQEAGEGQEMAKNGQKVETAEETPVVEKSVEPEIVETIVETTDRLEELLSPAYTPEVFDHGKPGPEAQQKAQAESEFVIVESSPERPEQRHEVVPRGDKKEIAPVQVETAPAVQPAQVSTSTAPPVRQGEPTASEDFSTMDMSMESIDTPAQSQSSQPFGLGSMAISEPAKPKEPVSANNVFGVPSTLASAPAPPAQNQPASGFFKAPVLAGFAPKTEESIFGKSDTFRQSFTFGQASGFGQQSSFGQSSTTATSFGQTTAFGQTSTFGQSSSFGQTSTLGQSSSFVQSSPASTPQASFGQPSFGQSSGFGQTSFGQPSFGSPSAPAFGASSFGQPTFGSPAAPTSQPAKVFGQGSSMAAGVAGFGSLAATAPETNPFGQPQQPDQQQQQQQKKNLPSSFTQFRA